jgi:hypothetical protein
MRFDDLPDDPNKKRPTLSFDDLPSAQKPRNTKQQPPTIDEEVRKPMGAVRAAGTAIATGMLPESLAGYGEQFNALARGRFNETPEESYQRGMRNLGEREAQAQEALGDLTYGALNLAGGLKTALNLPGISARVAKDAPALSKALAAGKRVVGGAGVAAMESKAREGISDKELSPVQSAALAAGLTGALEAGFPIAGLLVRGLARTPIIGQGLTSMARAVAEPATEAITQARRAASDYLAPVFSRAAQAIEPTDITKIQRRTSEAVPGSVTGPTVASMAGGKSATVAAATEAEVAARQGRLRAQEAAAARKDAEEEARSAIKQVKKEESTLTSLARQKAKAVGETGAARAKRLEDAAKGLTAQAKQEEAVVTSLLKQRAGEVKEAGVTRAERLAGASREARTKAKELQRSATKEAQQTALATREQAETAAQDVLGEAKAEAGEAVAGLRGAQPRGTASRLQSTIRGKQTAEATGHYEAVRAMGAPPEADPEVYKEIFANGALRNAYDSAAEVIRKEARNADPTRAATTGLRNVSVGGVSTPELTLEMMDQMRRNIMSPQVRKGPDVVGLSRAQKAEAIETINRLEERYLAGFGSDAAANALRTARSAYREKFQILEAVQDGLNLGTAKAGKASGLLKQSSKELDEVIKRFGSMTPKQQAAFRVGAREWFDRFVQEFPDDALGLAKKFSSEASQRRLALAYGDDAVEVLRQFAPDVIGQQRKAAAARVREEGRQVVQGIMERAGRGATALEARAARASALAERAKTQGATRAEQLVAQREAEAARGVVSAPTAGRATRAVELAQRAEGQSALRSQQILGQREADAATRLSKTRAEAGATVRTAREQARAAEAEASRLAQELTKARTVRAQTKGLPMGDLTRALGGSTQQQTFLQRLLPQMTAEQRAQAVEVMGSDVQRELQDMARAGKTPAEIIERLKALQQNDAVRELLGPSIGNVLSQLQQRQSMVGPLRAAFIGQAAGRM